MNFENNKDNSNSDSNQQEDELVKKGKAFKSSKVEQGSRFSGSADKGQGSYIKKIILVGFFISILVVVGCILLNMREPGQDLSLQEFPNQLESAIGLIKDINKRAYDEARSQADQDVVVATDINVNTLEKVGLLGLANAPGKDNPKCFGFKFKMYPELTRRSGPESIYLYMSPVLAWPLLMKEHQHTSLPVLLTLPEDGFILSGGKSVRIRWLNWNQLQPYLEGGKGFSPQNWPYLDRTKLRKRLKSFIGQIG